MTMFKNKVIILKNVFKTYYLYNDKWSQLKYLLKLSPDENFNQFHALKNINLTVTQGQKLGIIGRNGAGKTTLLKLLTGNFLPSLGHIQINGSVQALTTTGLGIHPDFTGMENIKSSLIYNAVPQSSLNKTIDDIVSFAELGDFIDQPVKTYSLGMRARLNFAIATAIVPDILVIDEVLSAGDRYFTIKSAERMKNLVANGCTLILVSYSNQQILEFCDTAIWLECGEIVSQGPSIDVVKQYEDYINKLDIQSKLTKDTSIIQSNWLREKILKGVLMHPLNKNSSKTHISRWHPTATGLKIFSFRLLDTHYNEKNSFTTKSCVRFELKIRAQETRKFDCYFVIVIYDDVGTVIM